MGDDERARVNRIEVLAQVDDGRLSVQNGANMLDPQALTSDMVTYIASSQEHRVASSKARKVSLLQARYIC